MLGSLISAGADLIGGLLGKKSADSANKDNYKHQKEFAQNSVQWRSEDAKKAGVSPLFALGMSPMSYSPSSVGDSSMSSAMSSMGQNLGRAVSATTGPQGRYDATIQALTLKRMGLENDLLASQINQINQPGNPPGIGSSHLIAGQGDVPTIDITPPTRTPYITRGDGSFIKTSPMMDAQVAENRYGDMLQEAFGLRTFLEDFFPKQIKWFDSKVYDGRSYRDLTEGAR